MRIVTYLAIALSLSPLARSTAQEGRAVPGARVRIWLGSCTGCERRVTGTLLSVWPDSMAVQSGPNATIGPLGLVHRVDVAVGTQTMTREGAVLGAALGALTAATAWQPCTDTGFMACLVHPSRKFTAVLGAAGGALVGLVIGSSIRMDTWERAPTASVHIGISTGAVRVNVAF